MAKKIIAFDLDDTLAISKSPISDRMSELLVKLLDYYDVCVISGGKFEQFKTQVIDRLNAPAQKLGRLHIMPTCGTRYYRFDESNNDWKIKYAEDLAENEKKDIIRITEQLTKEHGLWPENPYGEVIEDRGSQISVSMLGQQAPAEQKYQWAEKYHDQRLALRAAITKQLPQFEVRVGGTTTIDITRMGIDKAYGMRKLTELEGFAQDEILFIGDKLQEGGNDYPVKAMGIDCIEVSRWEDTIHVLDGILGVS